MGNDIAVRKGVIAEIVARAAASGDEVCGLLLGEPVRVLDVLHCTNVADDPATRFEIDPAELIAAHRAQRAGAGSIVGCYHSHPGGSASPSPRDAAEADCNGWLWLIVAGRETTLHRAIAGGKVHRMFKPMTIVPV